MKVTKRIRLEDLGLELRLLPSHIGEAVNENLNLEWMVAAAKSFCPFDTGTLMASIRAERRGSYESALVAGGGGWVNPKTGHEVDYAKPVHDGTSRMPARPFLLQAVIHEQLKFMRQVLEGTAEAVQ